MSEFALLEVEAQGQAAETRPAVSAMSLDCVRRRPSQPLFELRFPILLSRTVAETYPCQIVYGSSARLCCVQ